jgi:hypothetical protein
VAGGALIGLSGFLPWASGNGRTASAFDLSGKWLWEFGASLRADALKSIGIGLVVLAVVVVIGGVAPNRWLAVVGGALAVTAALLYVITVLRGAEDGFSRLGLGVWMAVGGGVVAVVGGLLSRHDRHRHRR